MVVLSMAAMFLQTVHCVRVAVHLFHPVYNSEHEREPLHLIRIGVAEKSLSVTNAFVNLIAEP